MRLFTPTEGRRPVSLPLGLIHPGHPVPTQSRARRDPMVPSGLIEACAAGFRLHQISQPSILLTYRTGVEMPSHYQIDPTRTDLAREFMANPMGPHGAALQRIVTRMRDPGPVGHYVLVTMVPYREWGLAQLSGKRGVDLTLIEDQVFTSREDAERTVFKLRWDLITGQPLELD